MKIFTILTVGLLFFISTFANAGEGLVLNNIAYQITAQQWVKTRLSNNFSVISKVHPLPH